MTVGIGVLCSTYKEFDDLVGKPRPDAIILIADTMGSTETDSTREMHKIFMDKDLGVFATMAGSSDRCGELFATFTDRLRIVKQSNILLNHGIIWSSLSDSVNGYRREKFQYDTLVPNFAWHQNMVPTDSERAQILEAYQGYELGVEMLLGTFDADGRALLYFIGRKQGANGFVHLVSVPGYFTIGAGQYNSFLWLNYRGQHLGCSIDRSLLHAFEASRFASSAPSVNSEAEIVICTSKCAVLRATHDDSPDHTEFPIKELIAEAAKYGPRSTKEIPFRRLDPLTFKGMP